MMWNSMSLHSKEPPYTCHNPLTLNLMSVEVECIMQNYRFAVVVADISQMLGKTNRQTVSPTDHSTGLTADSIHHHCTQWTCFYLMHCTKLHKVHTINHNNQIFKPEMTLSLCAMLTGCLNPNMNHIIIRMGGVIWLTANRHLCVDYIHI